ncbi:MAG: transposase [Candidatus Omnitrophica bacterium]|nr:transposase [Candidatus Omnitrophota bacterium]
MARPYRIQVEGGFYHITSRGNGRKNIYKSERDYEKFLEYLVAAKEKFKFYVHAYCLMTNHYHLFIETTQPNLSRIMQYLNTSYTVYYNHKRKKSGHLFGGRYKSILVEQDSYYNRLTRYIHLNPVRAKILKKPGDYRWSSYRAYIKGKTNGCVDITQVKQRLTMRLSAYRFFVETNQDNPDPIKQAYAGFMLGSVKFIKDNLNQLKAKVENKDFAHKRTIENTTEPERIIQVVAEYYKKEPEVLFKAKKKPLLAKKVAVYLLKRMTPLTNKDIGSWFGISHSGVSWLARDVTRRMGENSKIKRDVTKLNSHLEV